MIKKQSDLPKHDEQNQTTPNVGALTADREGLVVKPINNRSYARRYGVTATGIKTKGKITSTL